MSFEHTTQHPIRPDDSTQYSSAPLPTAATAPMASVSQAVPPAPTDAPFIQASASAPEAGIVRILSANSIPFSPSGDVALLQPSRSSPTEMGAPAIMGGNGGPLSPVDPDAQIIEALRSKDRLWVLKTGEMMEALIMERKQPRIDLNPATSYQRMLVHRCAAYYKLTPETDSVTKIISIYHRAESRIPARRISELVPAEESAQPAFQIMRRNVQGRRGRQNSETGDDADVSDAEPSETGSVSTRSNATGTSKRHLTIEEREAAYNEARSRIFMGFDGKEKEKDNASTNSSSLSINSTSAGRSSAGDGEESVCSAATESEWSGPVTRDKSRRGGSVGSSRSLRTGTYKHASGSNSSRHSRAASPSLGYPALYDPSAGTFDPAFGPPGPPHGYIQYYYPYPPPTGYAPPPSTSPGYGYGYPPYGFPPHPHHHSDPVTPSEHMYPQPPNAPYPPNAYQWATPGQPSHSLPPTTSPSNIPSNLPGAPPQSQTSPGAVPPHPAGYPGYFTPPYHPPYSVSGYYPPPFPPPSQTMPPPHMQGHYYSEHPHGGEFPGRNSEFGSNSADPSRASSRSSNGHGPTNGQGRRGTPRRQPWTYGPGIGMNPGNGEIVGPRLSSRRTSTGSQSTGNRTPGDEASSVASSSTTSSSSQRTFTSTSSKHPLPARPDWAVGLKAQPTLSSTRHLDRSDPNSRTMSPARMGGNLPHQRNHQQPPQPTDFPPLSSGPEKKTPVVGGAWTNPSNVRSALRVGPPNAPNVPPSSALVHYPSQASSTAPNAFANQNGTHVEYQDRAFERPPPNRNAELFDPRAGRPQQPMNGGVAAGAESYTKGEQTQDALAEQIGGLRLEAGGDAGGRQLTASPASLAAPADA